LAEDAIKAISYLLKDKELKRKYSEKYLENQINNLLQRVDNDKLSMLPFMRFVSVLSKNNDLFIVFFNFLKF